MQSAKTYAYLCTCARIKILPSSPLMQYACNMLATSTANHSILSRSILTFVSPQKSGRMSAGSTPLHQWRCARVQTGSCRGLGEFTARHLTASCCGLPAGPPHVTKRMCEQGFSRAPHVLLWRTFITKANPRSYKGFIRLHTFVVSFRRHTRCRGSVGSHA